MIRAPYDRRAEYYARQTFFCASVNQKESLSDQGENSRFAMIPVTEIEYEHAIDMAQVWAQVRDMYRNGEKWYLEKSCVISKKHSLFKKHTSIIFVKVRD